ncbi:low molecular weight phosphatase family protein [Yinghuangia sp. KLBMP8922]|uniref:Low molecular weight phosphatase family protein n=1 Tax=Yinghuangia soli TaxID=2908204 RepID=A0AA41Q0E8_9ACTN|nr:low molecular weight phosphatase family protein [Yinghuangia soli]
MCTGNLYRSPLAERLLAARLGAGGPEAAADSLPGIVVRSAGTHARPGAVLGADTRQVMAEFGGDGSGFAARRLTERDVAGADLVLGMAREHREAAVGLCPSVLRRCFAFEEFVRLAAVASEPAADPAADPREIVARAAALRGRVRPPAPDADDIADPVDLPPEALRACAARVDRAVRRTAVLLAPRHELLANG